jgi:hypothetical protein
MLMSFVSLLLIAPSPGGGAPEPFTPLFEEAPVQASADEDMRGLFVRKKGDKRYHFMKWKPEEAMIHALGSLMLAGGGELHFAPGTYRFERGINIYRIPDLTISGSPGVVLEFADGPKVQPLTLKPAKVGDMSLFIDRTEMFESKKWYELYAPNLDATRVLEFLVDSVEGNEVHLLRPVHFMPHVEEIPPGSRVVAQINMFRVQQSPNFTVKNLTMDGRGRGPFRGHTTWCGVYASGLYKKGERPQTLGVTVTGCSIKNFQGRGICVYGAGDVLIEGNALHDIRAQGIEIDHYSAGRVINNLIDGAETGILFNDAFESLAEGNVLRNCPTGIAIMRIFPEDWVNTGNIVRDNRIGPGCRRGVDLIDRLFDGIEGNVVRGNAFFGIEDDYRVLGGEGNTVGR